MSQANAAGTTLPPTTVTLSLHNARLLLRYLRRTSEPGQVDPLREGWRYLYALQDAVSEAERAL